MKKVLPLFILIGYCLGVPTQGLYSADFDTKAARFAHESLLAAVDAALHELQQCQAAYSELLFFSPKSIVIQVPTSHEKYDSFLVAKARFQSFSRHICLFESFLRASDIAQYQLHFLLPKGSKQKTKFNSTFNSKRNMQLFAFFLDKFGLGFPISDAWLQDSVWKKMAYCDHGIKAANGHRKAIDGSLCVNPKHIHMTPAAYVILNKLMMENLKDEYAIKELLDYNFQHTQLPEFLIVKKQFEAFELEWARLQTSRDLLTSESPAFFEQLTQWSQQLFFPMLTES